MSRKEIIGSHVSVHCATCLGTSDHGLRISSLVPTTELKEIIDLLAMLLIVLVGDTLLIELSVSHFAISGYWSIRIHSLLAQSDYSNAIIHLAREHMLIRG